MSSFPSFELQPLKANDSSSSWAEIITTQRELVAKIRLLAEECRLLALQASLSAAGLRSLERASTIECEKTISDGSAVIPVRVARECPGDRRRRELCELESQGFPAIQVTKWHWRIDKLSLWPHSGRWFNEATGYQGWMRSISMNELIARELAQRHS